jgi:IclR family transcriptional regulator, KDG regulon repressor
MSDAKKSSTNFIQSVDRALQILECFSNGEKELGVTEISRMLSLHKSTVFGLLATLENRGYMEQDLSSGKYKLGMKLFELGARVQNNMDIAEIAKPYLEDIVKKYNETVHLVMNDKGQAVYIDKVEGSTSMRMYSQLGKRPPMYCTGVGKSILAFMPQEYIDDYLSNEDLKKLASNTITDVDGMNKELEKVRSQGYSIDDEEIEDGLRCVAAPIFDHKGDVAGALSIAGPTSRMTKTRMKELAGLIKETARQISNKLGYKNDVR